MRLLIRYLGYILLISALFRIIPIAAGFIYKEPTHLFFTSAAISIALGLLLLWYEKKLDGKETPLSLSQALMLAALAFIVLSAIGSISFLPSFGYNFLDACFESVSGFTTTGLTLYSSLGGLPKSLLLWRAETQWIGGIGIIMVFLFIISRLRFHSGESAAEAQAEATAALYQSQGFPQKLEPSLKNTTKNVTLIYGGYTLLGIILLSVAGMPLFESIAMSFTSISTGGFVVSDSFGASNVQLAVLCLMMLLGSISFIAHNSLLKKKFREFLNAFEKNVFLVFLLVAIILALASYRNIRVVLFELVSAFTTTGYSIAEISLLPHIMIMLVMIGMVVGGGIASTSGGMKVSRVYSIIRSIPWLLKKLCSPPHAVVPFQMHGKSIEESDLVMVYAFGFCFVALIAIGTAIFLLLGHSFLDSSFQVTSALGTVGMQTMELAGVHWLGKAVLMIAMLFGRLEIFPFLILIRMIFRR